MRNKTAKDEKQVNGKAGDDALQILTVRLPVWLHKALKVKCAQEGRKMQDVAFEKLSEDVGGKRPTEPRPRTVG